MSIAFHGWTGAASLRVRSVIAPEWDAVVDCLVDEGFDAYEVFEAAYNLGASMLIEAGPDQRRAILGFFRDMEGRK